MQQFLSTLKMPNSYPTISSTKLPNISRIRKKILTTLPSVFSRRKSNIPPSDSIFLYHRCLWKVGKACLCGG